MCFIKIFYKNITFFLSLYFICQILSTDICIARNTERRPFFTTGPQNGMVVHMATVTHTIKEQNLFAFGQKKNHYKGTKSSFKRKKNSWVKPYHFEYVSRIHFGMGLFFFIPISFTWVDGTAMWWILFPAIILAASAGYLYGKRKGRKIAATKEFPAYVPAPVVLSKEGRYEDLAEEKPFMQKYDMVTVMFADIEGF